MTIPRVLHQIMFGPGVLIRASLVRRGTLEDVFLHLTRRALLE